MPSLTNPYCETLGIRVPRLEAVLGRPEAGTYALLIVALLERGGPMTLEEVAARLARAGVGPVDEALVSLKRCRPARPPVYRDGDLYSLDLHDDDLDLRLFTMGLRPPKVAPVPVPTLADARPSGPLPGPGVPVTVAELEEAWRDASLFGWSSQRLAICILEAHGRPMRPTEATAFVARLTQFHLLKPAGQRWGRPSPIRVLEDGRWALETGHPAVPSARRAVRERIAAVRKWATMRPDPAALDASHRAYEERRQEHSAELARLRRALVHAFPPKAPQMAVLIDIAARQLTTYQPDDLDELREHLGRYDLIAGLDVRPLLRALGFNPAHRRLAELGPPQKSITINQRGRTLRITTPLLVWGSCGIGRPFGDQKRLNHYLRTGQETKLRRRLEADAKALMALYAYGRLHGAVRLKWGFLEAMIPAPWTHPDETRLYGLMARAQDLDAPLEVVVGNAPGWEDPWSRVRRCRVVSEGRWEKILVDEKGAVFEERDVQLARLAIP